MTLSQQVKEALTFISATLSQDVLPYFDIHKELSASDLSLIASKFLTLQQSIVDLNNSFDQNLLDIEAQIQAFNNSSAGSSASVRGAFSNLKLSTSGLDANITVTIDEIVLKSNTGYKTVSNISQNSAPLDTGSIAPSTWYAVFVISNGTNTQLLKSLSFTSPTLPTGYTYFARIGSVRTDSTLNAFPFPIIQYGNNVQYKLVAGSNLTAPRSMASGILGTVATPVWLPVSTSAFVPSTAKIININAFSTTSGTFMLAPNNVSGSYTSTLNPPPYYGNIAYSEINASMLLESTNIYLACNVACYVFCFGWEDNL